LRRPLGALADARAHASEKFDAVEALTNGGEGPFPTVARIGDLNTRFGPPGRDGRPRECVWMCDENGPEAICEKARLLFPDLPDQTNPSDGGKGGDMTFSTAVPGLPGGPLATDYPIHLKILPDWMTQNRPGIPASTPRRSVQHGNGNPNSAAAS
jgi:hypothetical protein